MFDLGKFSRNVAVITADSQYTYGELKEFIDSIQSIPGSGYLTYILCGNNMGSLIGYLASLTFSCPALLLNKDMDERVFSDYVRLYPPRYLWVPEERSAAFINYRIIWNLFGYDLLENSMVTDRYPKELALMLTTSGSTGSPKLVRLSFDNLYSNAASIMEYLSLNPTERPVTSLPMYYSFGLSVINSHLLTGATLLLTDLSYVQKEFWSFAEHNGCTSFSGVPFTYEILKKIHFWKNKIPSLKTLTQAGGKLNDQTLSFFITNARENGVNFFLMYGQTEATARMSYLPPEVALEKLGSIGKAIPGGEFTLRADDGTLITGSGITGELVYTGKNVSLGYAQCKEDLMKEDENKGVLFTGDLAYRDEDGYLYITGRKKRFLKLFGNRISLDYTENILKELTNECVCVGTDNKMLIYTTKENNDIIPFLVSRLKINRSAFEVRQIGTIPRNESGKVMYSELSNI